jgi:hypothetical protein
MEFGDIYRVNIGFINKPKTKIRPAVILKLNENGVDKCYGVYSSKDFWDRFDRIKSNLMYKPRDYSFSRLKSSSYINISDLEDFDSNELSYIDFIGQLSKYDLVGVVKSIRTFQEFKSHVEQDNPENISSYLELWKNIMLLNNEYNTGFRRPFVKSFNLYVTDKNITPEKLNQLCFESFITN